MVKNNNGPSESICAERMLKVWKVWKNAVKTENWFLKGKNPRNGGGLWLGPWTALLQSKTCSNSKLKC